MNIKLTVVLVILCGFLSAGIAFTQPADEGKIADRNIAFRSNTENSGDLPTTDAVEIYYYFTVSENIAGDPETKVEINPDVPEGLIYRIQVGAFRYPVSPLFFKGITPVHGFTSESSDLKVYYVGMFRRLSDAGKALTEVKELGLKASFITSFAGNKPVSANQAALLEKEWGKKPFERIENIQPVVIPADTHLQILPQTLPAIEEAKSVTESVRTSDTLRADALKIFVDCRSCDMNYTRQEIPFVNYVRDTREAEVYLLVSNQQTGSGGNQYTFAFQGQGKYAGMDDTLTYTSNPDETSSIIREKKTHMIKMGLIRYVARTPLYDEIDIKNNGEIKQHETEDKWNNWVFMLQTSPRFNAEATYNRVSLWNSIDISKVTPDLKLEIKLDQFTNTQKFIEGEEVTEYKSSSKSLDNLFVLSLGNHWSAGINWDIGSSTNENYDLHTVFLPTVEYDIYPYSEATHRQFRILYSVGYDYSDYIDTTIFNKMYEGRFRHGLRAAYQIQKKWGNINFSVSGSNYLDDFSKNKVDFWGFTRLRIVKGLALSVNGGISYVNDQINLAKGELTEAERLLRLKEQATNFYVQGGVSLSYTFGSIYNNVVNPRFGNSGGNYYY
jgi:hypothetical protein